MPTELADEYADTIAVSENVVTASIELAMMVSRLPTEFCPMSSDCRAGSMGSSHSAPRASSSAPSVNRLGCETRFAPPSRETTVSTESSAAGYSARIARPKCLARSVAVCNTIATIVWSEASDQSC
ncbi:MAG: hypothetical protein R2703_13895 [Micropruina glycogenica]